MAKCRDEDAPLQFGGIASLSLIQGVGVRAAFTSKMSKVKCKREHNDKKVIALLQMCGASH